MKPLFLEIKGLGSFQELQKIDFENLSTSGIFGIFGKTGAGKSTILDSLTLALYNNIDRYAKKDRAEMININSEVCNVSFTFSVKNGADVTIYKVDREYKINKKSEKLDPKKHILCKKVGDIFEPIDEGVTNVNNKILEIINLSYDDFTKTVILPQGKFSDFINLDNENKRRMLERIFNLEEYGKKLTEQFNSKFNELKIQYEGVSKQLELFEEYTDDAKKEVELKLKSIDSELINLNKQLKMLNEESVASAENLKNAKSYQVAKLTLEKLEKHKDEIDDCEEILKTKSIYKQVQPLKEKGVEIGNKLNDIKHTLDEHNKKLATNNQNLEQFIKDFETIQKEVEFNKKELEENKVSNEYVQSIDKLAQLEVKVKENVKTIEKNNKTINENTKEIEKYDTSLTQLETLISEQSKIISELKSEKQQKVKAQSYWQNCFQIIQENLKNKTVFKDTSEKVFHAFNFQLLEILKSEKAIEKAKQEITDFEKNNMAVTLAKSLVQGSPCPVCGSLSHPKVAKKLLDSFTTTKEQEIKIAENKIKLAENKIKLYSTEVINRMKSCADRSEKIDIELEKYNKELLTFKERYAKEKTVNDKLKEDNEKLSRIVSEALSENTKILVEINETKPKYEFTHNFIDEKAMLNEKLQKAEELSKKLEESDNILIELRNRKDETYKIVNELKVEIATNTAKMTDFEENKVDIEQNIKNILEDNNMDESDFEKMNKFNFDELEKKVKMYYDHILINQDKVSSLRQYENVNYQELESNARELTSKIKDLQNNISELMTNKGSKEEKLKLFVNKLNDKNELKSKYTGMGKEYDNMMDLKPLIQGNKFIEYIARTDLEEVVYFASKEFNKLTNGKYFLKLSDSSLDIEVIDNLQGGKCRSIKTLSGGETFIISLCLSLSLSRKIQMKRNSIIEFFFLDEGFGSLDNESLENVMDSLNSLKNESINIGIITHVDKVKENVPKILYVENSVNGTKVRIG